MAVIKAGALYMAGKLFRKIIPSTTLILWVVLVAGTRISFLTFLVVFLVVPAIARWIVCGVWGNEITYTG